MKRTCTETFSITSFNGHRNGNYDSPEDAYRDWRKMDADKRKRFGITCKEIYNWYDDNGKWYKGETYEGFVNIEDLWGEEVTK